MYTSFQTAFLEATQEYYAVEGRRLVTTLTVPEYLQYISKRMQQEQSRIEDYLHTDTWVPVCAIMRQELLKTHVSELLEKGFHAMVKDSKLDELKMLYRLLSTVDALEDLKVHFITYLRAACSEMVLDEARDSSMVVDLLVLRSKIDTILEKSFGNQEKLRNACKDAFEATINARPNKPAELVAKFIDRKLRAGYKNTTEGELDELLDDVMALFRLIHVRDW
ncbi:hypothetical protein SARC_12549 [Sphaeroforma arctica JP610]|uniref:Cullin family profile domain-containing protein n=1 Tax=Sphaeroforma arctica JP610 TaxID=667725 RepID=A0A0L0FDT2_9EUKA|nr:hypothetical protein SARC_12549 [Sphaeroforma arctica JP610]KNC74915.1 hypothetical protein SARC_12549 [Sphaeroforma arctica JP610]|eukprot:XP_014148817.1 hypothetical protein SARC_12549 [Sphaeroforma arctica JP610]